MKYVIYARKSTESEDRQALSIQSQIHEMKEVAKRDHLQIVDILQESKSAKQPGRPIFNAMIEKFKSGKYEGVLCWKIDRLARNSLDAGMVQWLLEKEIIKQIKTFERDYNPSDNVVVASIEFSMASQYIKELSRNVKRGQAEKIRRGEYPATPPLGYLLDYKTKKILIDEERYQYIKDAFRLYATGNYSIPRLAEKLSEDGLRSRNGKRVYGGALYKILKNPIYYGWFRWKEQIYKGTHSPIVSKDLFDEVENVFYPRKKLSKRGTRNLPFRGHMVCGECGLKITGEIQKGIKYYHCTKSKGADKCSQKYIREDDLIKEIDKQLAKLSLNAEMLDMFGECAIALGHGEWEKVREIEKNNQTLLAKNKFLQDSLVEKFIDNAIPEEIYNRKLAEYRNEQASIEDKLNSIKENSCNVFEKIEQAVKFTKFAKKIFDEGNDEEKKEVVAIISSNIKIKDRKIAEFKLSAPFDAIVEALNISNTHKPSKKVIEQASFASTKMKKAPAMGQISVMHGV